MDDITICRWAVRQQRTVGKFLEQAAQEAKPKRLDVFHKLITLNNSLVELFWEINIARDNEHLDRIANPHY